MPSKRFLIYLMVLGMVISISGCEKKAPEGRFTAELVVRDVESEMIGTLTVTPTQYRMDFTEQERGVYFTAFRDSNIVRIFIPDVKEYQEIETGFSRRFKNDPFLRLKFTKGGSSGVLHGTETVNGYECERFDLFAGDQMVMSYWNSTKLDFPLKIVEYTAEEAYTEVRNISETAINDSIFLVPDDFTKMANP